MFEKSDLIHSYTRAQAIADGVLIDAGATAKEAGIRYPVALTAAVWERCVTVPPGVHCQDEAGRLWDVLWLLRLAIGRIDGPEVRFGVHVRNDNGERTPPLVRLKAVCGPGDDGEPCPSGQPHSSPGRWQPCGWPDGHPNWASRSGCRLVSIISHQKRLQSN